MEATFAFDITTINTYYTSSSNMDVFAAAAEEADIVQSISYTQTST